MKDKYLDNRNKESLQETLAELKEQLVQLQFELTGKNLKNVSKIGKIKRDIARTLTALRQIESQKSYKK